MSQEEDNDLRQQRDEAGNPTLSPERLEALSTYPYLRGIVASNPGAPASLLERLARDPHDQIRQAVAGNPNTPWPLLVQLAWEFPRAFLSNPVGPFQIMAYPEQINTDEVFWNALLREASIPSLWWNWLLSHQL
ncbi:MAG TPA: hypothetical protein VFN35_11495 [Ktedonobacteraceae bacterium]|nr:hypothetical protein [Ktedonobacteraceae bacterium]